MPTKRYSVSFYQASHQNNIPASIADDLLGGLVGTATPSVTARGYVYEVVVERIATGCYRGELKRYGNDDLPHAGRPAGTERELEIDDDEMTIERNYFLFYQNRKLLVWQENRRGSSILVLGEVLSEVLAYTISFSPVMTSETTQALLLGRHKPRVIEFSLAKPTNAAMYQGAGRTDEIMRLLSGLGAMSGSFRISANAPGIRSKVLNAAAALGFGNDLVDSGFARKVRLELEGVDHPIDLLADRLRCKVDVEMQGRYPVPHSMYQALGGAYGDFAVELAAIFG